MFSDEEIAESFDEATEPIRDLQWVAGGLHGAPVRSGFRIVSDPTSGARCACGCDQYPRHGKRFVHGHHRRGVGLDPLARRAMRLVYWRERRRRMKEQSNFASALAEEVKRLREALARIRDHEIDGTPSACRMQAIAKEALQR